MAGPARTRHRAKTRPISSYRLGSNGSCQELAWSSLQVIEIAHKNNQLALTWLSELKTLYFACDCVAYVLPARSLDLDWRCQMRGAGTPPQFGSRREPVDWCSFNSIPRAAREARPLAAQVANPQEPGAHVFARRRARGAAYRAQDADCISAWWR